VVCFAPSRAVVEHARKKLAARDWTASCQRRLGAGQGFESEDNGSHASIVGRLVDSSWPIDGDRHGLLDCDRLLELLGRGE